MFAVGNSIAVRDVQAKSTQFFSKENRLKYLSCINAMAKKSGNVIFAVGDSPPSAEDRVATVRESNNKFWAR